MAKIPIEERYQDLVFQHTKIYNDVKDLLAELDDFMAEDKGKYSLSDLNKVYKALEDSYNQHLKIRSMMNRARDNRHGSVL